MMDSFISKFHQQYTLNERKKASADMLHKYPDRRPIIVDRGSRATIPLSNKNKFLVPSDITLSKFIQELRSNIKLEASQGMYIFTKDDTMPNPTSTIGQLYEQKKDEDGFLYIIYSGENAFGSY